MNLKPTALEEYLANTSGAAEPIKQVRELGSGTTGTAGGRSHSTMNLKPAALEAYLATASGEAVRIEQIRELGSGTTGAAALKAFGYGRPICVEYQILAHSRWGATYPERRRIVLRQVSRNGFGRERDSDRVAEVWLDFKTFNHLPRHVHAQDIVALAHDGHLESLRCAQDVVLVTDYAAGQPYADDLLRIRDEGATSRDLQCAEALADYLADIHAVKHNDPLLWRRRLRDLIGHGEGIMGLADSYPPGYPLATAGTLRAIEEAANEWRWRLKPLTHRLSQVHGDFHPFNILFTENEEFTLLDRSRGEWGEPADDVSCLTINYLFFSLQRYGKLTGPFWDLYEAFWQRYLDRSQDTEMPLVIQPWFAWRALVLASPQWYPTIDNEVRRQLLDFARNVMVHRRFRWDDINTYVDG